MNRGQKIVGIVLIAVSIAALISWEKWGKQQFLYDEVLVCSENVERGTILQEDMLQVIKMDVREEGWIKPSQKKEIIGKEASSHVHKGMPLFREYFDLAGLNASDENDRFILSVPADWIESVPASLKRGDQVQFFRRGKLITSAPVSAVNREYHTVEVIVEAKQASLLSKAAAEDGKMVMIYS